VRDLVGSLLQELTPLEQSSDVNRVLVV